MAESFSGEVPSLRARILLADDHQLVLERVTRLLQSAFDVVGAAHDGQEMVEQAMRLMPDVIVTDISMPGLSGLEAVHQLHALGRSVPIIFLSVHNSPEFVEACLAEGALGFVTKSQMRRDLIPAINAALSGRSYISAEGRPKV
jgi:DNA-binding NarL/FixJ family response regulator